MRERFLRKGRPLEAAVAQQITLEAQLRQPRQHRPGAGTVIDIGRRQLKLEQPAVLVTDRMPFDALDQLAAIDAAHPATRASNSGQQLGPATRGGALRAAVGHDG